MTSPRRLLEMSVVWDRDESVMCDRDESVMWDRDESVVWDRKTALCSCLDP